ncbi:hypothetical protein ES703_121353 [subsurface metagenome]
MPKLKNPVLSLGATGTLAESITFTRRRKTNIVEKKPVPTYRRTLPQNYQRWDYEDGIFYWHALTDAQRQEWRSKATRYHMTGFAYFMRWYLLNLPDLLGRWHLDTVSAAQTPDSSKNTNTGTVFGASLTDGYIDHCLSFDGVDDFVKCGSAFPHVKDEITIILRTWIDDQIGVNNMLTFKGWSWRFFVMSDNNGTVDIRCNVRDTAGAWHNLDFLGIPKWAWHQLALTYKSKGGTCYFYCDDQRVSLVYSGYGFRPHRAIP